MVSSVAPQLAQKRPEPTVPQTEHTVSGAIGSVMAYNIHSPYDQRRSLRVFAVWPRDLLHRLLGSSGIVALEQNVSLSYNSHRIFPLVDDRDAAHMRVKGGARKAYACRVSRGSFSDFLQ
jgi:hypothetical protein